MRDVILKIFMLLLTLSFALPVFSYELDTSVDAEIRKKYDSNKLNETVLPDLPSHLKNNSPSSTKVNTSVPKTMPTYSAEPPNIIKASVDSKNSKKIGYGTKFPVKSTTKVNDWLRKGSHVYFVLSEPVIKRGITIPAGTSFTGVITDVHRPQISGNGGLVKVCVTSMKYNGNYFEVDGKITKANHKKIFFNNIKGQRQYINGVKSQVTKGENFYQKMRNTSSKMSKNPVGTIFSPFPTIIGFLGGTVCTIVSPITGLGKKGGDISIPEGSVFEIKLTKGAYVY